MSDEAKAVSPLPWTYDQPFGDILDGDRVLATQQGGTDDEMKLMAAAPGLAQALRDDITAHNKDMPDKYRADFCCGCPQCRRNRALLASL